MHIYLSDMTIPPNPSMSRISLCPYFQHWALYIEVPREQALTPFRDMKDVLPIVQFLPGYLLRESGLASIRRAQMDWDQAPQSSRRPCLQCIVTVGLKFPFIHPV